MRNSLINACALLFCMTAGVSVAAPFKDISDSHWACEAIANLTSKGLIEGVTADRFEGNRNTSRYELAVLTARMLAYAENNGGSISKTDLQTLEKLTVEFADELALLGVKVTSLEDDMKAVKEDVASLKSDVSSIVCK